mmetsp:Transcript_4165/g.12517  ORF Transcript_4165/g.12517 Transcript_4165/m.12517 type:complete len:206 (-) Transcript_4165:46-663(-)
MEPTRDANAPAFARSYESAAQVKPYVFGSPRHHHEICSCWRSSTVSRSSLYLPSHSVSFVRLPLPYGLSAFCCCSLGLPGNSQPRTCAPLMLYMLHHPAALPPPCCKAQMICNTKPFFTHCVRLTLHAHTANDNFFPSCCYSVFVGDSKLPATANASGVSTHSKLQLFTKEGRKTFPPTSHFLATRQCNPKRCPLTKGFPRNPPP